MERFPIAKVTEQQQYHDDSDALRKVRTHDGAVNAPRGGHGDGHDSHGGGE